jgi:farnesyl diphosphate synthase
MSISKAAKRAKFEEAYAAIREELLAHFSGEGMPDTAAEWYRESLDYNVPGGKLNRGLSVVDSTEILKGRALTDVEYTQAAVLGWCVELVRTFNFFFLVFQH